MPGGEGENDERDNVGHHIVDAAGNIERIEEVNADIDVRQRPEQSEQQRRKRNARGLPLPEDHDREGEEAEACHAVFELPLGNAGENIGDAAHPPEKSGDQHTCPAHPENIDAHAVRRLRVLAARHKAQTEFGMIEHHIDRDQRKHGHDHKPVELQTAELEEEHLLRLDILDRGGNVVGVGGGIHCLDKHRRAGGAEHVERGADDGLVRLKVDAGDAEQRRICHAERDCRQNDQQDHDQRRSRLEIAHDERAAERADNHDALKTEVDDAGMLGNAAAERDQKQNGSEDERILDQQQHYIPPPFLDFSCSAGAFSSCSA